MSDENSSVPAPPPLPTTGSAPPPPPPMPGTKDAPKVQTYKEKRDLEKAQEPANGNSIESQQFANLPEKLLNTMKREKKPFTYTPLSVGDNGKLDLSQIKSPRMKKRLMANMRDDDEEQEVPNGDAQEIESIEQSLQSNRAQPEVNLGILNEHSSRSMTPQSASETAYGPPLPRRQTSLNRENIGDPWNGPISSANASQPSPPTRQVYGQTAPPKINIGQELWQERNANLTPSRTPITPSAADQLDNIWKPTPQPPPVWQSTSGGPSSYSSPGSAYTTPTPNLSSPSSNVQATRQIPVKVQFADDDQSEPIQSRSFKLLQKMTAGIEDELQQLRLLQKQQQPQVPDAYIPPPAQTNQNVEPPAYLGTLNHVEPPRVRGEVRIPVQIERREDHSGWTRTIPVQHTYTSESSQTFSDSGIRNTSFAPLPPTRFNGSHIPSRSFRMLQMMTGELDDFW